MPGMHNIVDDLAGGVGVAGAANRTSGATAAGPDFIPVPRRKRVFRRPAHDQDGQAAFARHAWPVHCSPGFSSLF